VKINPIFKSVIMFILILLIFSSTIIYFSSKMIEDTLDSNDKERINYTIDSIIPLIKTSIEFSLESFLEDNLNEIIDTNNHILKIVIKRTNGELIVQSNRNEFLNKEFISRKFPLNEKENAIIEIYPSNNQKSNSFKIYESILFKLIISVPFLIAIAIFFYSAIIALQNKEKQKAYDELKEQMNLEIQNHEKKTNMLFHQSRLAQMGEMISNIAHQWRQPLNTVSLVLQNLKISYAMNNLKKDDFEESMQKIEGSLQYMSKTITTFRNFYKTNTEPEIFHCKDIINESIGIIGNSLDNLNIELRTKTDIDASILGFKNELSQVIVNIIANAKEAFEKRNTANAKIKINTSKPDDEIIVISIEDNAGGIKKDMIEKIFDPYFTTKHKTQGIGLGLYMSKIIVKEKFKGNLIAINTKDGARFDIQLNIYKG